MLEIAHRLIPELRDALQLERISVPLLLVWGDRDRLVFHRGAQQILDAVPGARASSCSRESATALRSRRPSR